MMVSGKQILEVAIKEIGYREGADKSNKYGAWYGMDRVSWCMEFVQWVYAQAGMPLPHKTASCGVLLHWYLQCQPDCVVNEPVKGCLVIFDFPGTNSLTDHVGLFEGIQGQYITTVDGNTSSQSNANGGCVNRITRQKKFVHRYIKPRGLVEMTGQEILDALTEKQAYELLIKADRYAQKLSTPDWMSAELCAAKEAGITDGTSPLSLCTRGQAAMMALRAGKAAGA